VGDCSGTVSVTLTTGTPTALVVLPVCGSQAFPRQSRTGLRHFVHRTGAGCADHPGETPQHLAAKTVIVQAALQARWDAVPEQPSPAGRGQQGPAWVADVLASSGRRRVALEVQWSRQALQRYRDRQNAYRDSDVRAVWFVRHEESLRPPDKEFPVFHLSQLQDQDDAQVPWWGRVKVCRAPSGRAASNIRER